MSRRALAMVLLAGGCATLAEAGPGLDDPPHAEAGPFRLLVTAELGAGRVAPVAIDDDARGLGAPSVVDLDGDPSTLPVAGFFASGDAEDPLGPSRRIVRHDAIDGRSFARGGGVVLVPEHTWEGGRVGAPSVLRVSDVLAERSRWVMFYEAEGGIGRASSDDGVTFRAEPAPALASVPWADGPPRAPGALLAEDGSVIVYFEADRGGVTVVGEAQGLLDGPLEAVGSGPAIVPGASEAFDAGGVGGPSPVRSESNLGRVIHWVYFDAVAADGRRAIGVAARFADEGGALEKNASTVYAPASKVQPFAPSVVRFDDFTLLFAAQQKSSGSDARVVTVGKSPGDAELPEAAPEAD